MAKMMDITDKLTFGENPRLRIKDEELEVHADTATVLQIMELLGDGDTGTREVIRCADLLLGKESRKKLEALNLPFADYMMVINQAMTLATGTDDEEGGAGGDPTTT